MTTALESGESATTDNPTAPATAHDSPRLPASPLTVYVLRHEQRGPDQTYASRLTAEGRAASLTLAARLRSLGIDAVYCSPFHRALETAAPFLRLSGLSARLEWGLCELLASRQHRTVDPARGPAPRPSAAEAAQLGCCVDGEYQSVVAPAGVRPGETLAGLEERVRHFLAELDRREGGGAGGQEGVGGERRQQQQQQRTILLCTHMHVCNAVLRCEDPTRDMKAVYPQGEVTPVVLRFLQV